MSKISEIAIVDENEQSTTYEIQDAPLTLEVASLNERLTAIEGGSGLTDEVKSALLQLVEKLAYIDDNGQTYYDNLRDALYPPIPATSITLSSSGLSFSSLGATQQLTATLLPANTTDTVYWTSSDESIATVGTADGMVESIDYGSAVITATAGNVTASCSVIVAQATLSSITAVYTQPGTVYDTATLDSLKTDLVVTAHWSNGTTEVIDASEYVLSGTLEVGTSTITASYGGESATFTVTVTRDTTYIETVLATLIPGTDFTYTNGSVNEETGEVTESAGSTYRISELITIPEGTTSFSYKFSKTDTNSFIPLYNSAEEFVGNGFGAGTYSGNGTYGDAYTDGEGDAWHAVPANAKYVRVQWRPSDNNFSKLMFKHNSKLDETVTPVVDKVYYYTYTGSSTSANSDNYLPCAGLAYVHSRPVYRRGYTFYDSEKITVSSQSVANNIGNNVSIPSGAAYIKFGNATNKSTDNAKIPTRNGVGLIMFSDATKTAW